MIRQVILANAILLVQYAVGSLVPLLLLPHIVRTIGLAEYGHLAILMAWGGYGAIVVQYAFQLTGPKRVAQLSAGESIANIFIDITFAKIFLLFVVIVITGALLFITMPDELDRSLAWVILFAMPIAACFNSVWFLQAQDRFLHISLLAVVGTLVTLFIGFNFVSRNNPHAIDFAVVATVFGQVFVGIGTMILAFLSTRGMRWQLNISRSISSLADGKYLFISQFISMLYGASGPIVISYLADTKAAGAYSVTERVINALVAAALLTHTAAYPRLASAYTHNKSAYWKMQKFILTGYLSVTAILAVLVLLVREFVIRFLYGEVSNEYDGLLFFGLAWLMLGIFGTSLTGYLTVSGRSQEIWPLTLKILMLSVLVGIPGVLLFGGVGWMASLAFSQIIVLQTGFKHWKREYGNRACGNN